jgi:DNA-binding NarL/FixJ family response regulator
MMPAIRLLIVHDDQLKCQCIAAVLTESGRFAAVDLASSAGEAIERAAAAPYDVVLVSWVLPNLAGLDLARRLVLKFPGVKVLMFDLAEDPDCARACAAAGCTGLVLRHEGLDQLLARIEQAVCDETTCPPGITRTLFSSLEELSLRQINDGCIEESNLTVREREVLGLIVAGLSNKQIAARLCLSPHTVKNHVHNLLEKLALPGRVAAVRYAHEKQLYGPASGKTRRP